MKSALLVSLTAIVPTLVGCAGSAGPGEVQDRTEVSLGTAQADGSPVAIRSFTITNDPTMGEAVLDAGPSSAWAALEAMVVRNDLPVAESEPARGRMIVRGRMPRLDGARMSRWFDCGRDVTGPVADRATVEVAIGFQVAPVTATRTQVAWSIQAHAEPRYSSDNRIACNPRDALGQYLVAELAGGSTG